MWGCQVRNALYQLPIRPFALGSISFAKQYHLIEDTSDEHEQIEVCNCPSVVLDVERGEFEAFLQYLLPTYVFIKVMGLWRTNEIQDWMFMIATSGL